MDIGWKCQDCGALLPKGAPEGLCPRCLLQAALGTRAPSAEPTPPAEPSSTTQLAALPDPAKLAQFFPQLDILELIGQGGMGAVYKARQPALDRLVALKILPRQASSEPGFAERFTREARALARLNHPHIVAVYEFGQAHGLHFLVLEHVEGQNLRQVERTARLTPSQALELIPQICDALQFAHDQGVIHRDIKPENVLVDHQGRVKITDFGLAKILGREAQDRHLTAAGDVMGTPHYMAPEQVERPQAVDHRADIYSLGVVFYELLTGELPLGRFAPPSRKAQVDARLDEVVLRALEPDPQRRYQSASQFKADVEAFARHQLPAVAMPPTPALSAASDWRPARGTLAGSAAVLFFVLLVLFQLAPSGPPLPRGQLGRAGRSSLADVPKPAPLPPVVIKTIPESGAATVDPDLAELRVTFSAPMQDGRWSWTKYGDENFPETTGSPRYLADGRTCVCPVRLKAGKLYAVWLNSDSAHDFQDRHGQAALPYLLIFETRQTAGPGAPAVSAP